MNQSISAFTAPEQNRLAEEHVGEEEEEQQQQQRSEVAASEARAQQGPSLSQPIPPHCRAPHGSGEGAGKRKTVAEWSGRMEEHGQTIAARRNGVCRLWRRR